MNTNSVTLIGRATRDTELKTTASGTSVATISLAVNGYNDEVSYIDVVTFNKTAEVAEKYVGKGKQIAITGRLQQQRWEKDGQKRSKIEVIANTLELLGGDTKPKDNIPTEIDESISLSSIPF